jgi:hypothetical protein
MFDQKMTAQEITEYIRQEAIDVVDFTKSLQIDLPLPTSGWREKAGYFGAQFGLWTAGLGFGLVARILPEPLPRQSDSPPEGE